jgi:hypothetical protein
VVLDYPAMKAWDFGEIRQTYSRRDTLFYALGVGLGADPLDAGQLRFVYEKDLQALPTLATVLAWPRFSWSDPRTGVDYLKLVHGEQHLRLFKPLPVEATVSGRDRVVSRKAVSGWRRVPECCSCAATAASANAPA